jgi:hypothetical protein
LLKYKGGGDWYANPTSLPNLAKFCNQQLHLNLSTDIGEIEPGSAELFNYSFVHITGHGNIIFTDQEAANLRTYLMAGGFLHVSDNFGIDPFIRKAMKKFFLNSTLLNYHIRILYIIRNMIFQMACQKYTNTKKNQHKVSDLFTKAV